MNLFSAKSIKGKLEFSNQKVIEDFLYANDGKEFWVRLDRTTGKRSLSQNNFYWIYLEIISKENGHTAKELHELFKRLFLKPQFTKVLGRELKLPASTTELSKHDFGEYLDKICAETGVPIPETEETRLDVAKLYKDIAKPIGEVPF